MNKMHTGFCAEFLCNTVSSFTDMILRRSILSLILAVFIFIGIVPIYGSIYESPNSYTYVYPYNDHQYKDYTIHNRSEFTFDFTEEATIPSLCPDAVVNTATMNSSFPINISLSGFEKGDYKFNLWLDKEQIVSKETRYWESDPITFSSTGMSYSEHELIIQVIQDDTLSIVDDTFNVMVMDINTVFRNPFGDEILLYHLLPSNPDFIGIALFVEGFDLSFDGASTVMTGIANSWRSSGLDDCDIALLKLAEPTRDARDNAMSVLAATRFIHQYYSEDLCRNTEGVRLFGFSMGGVLSRYALAFAEHNSIKHNCVQFISLDAPHKGAALNHELQRMVKKLNNFINGIPWPFNRFASYMSNKKKINKLNSSVKSPVAKQLLRQNIWADPENHTYLSASNDCLDFFSEINTEERSVYYPQRPILNYDMYDDDSKPGFPYKQNRIKSMSYVNGSLFQSGGGSTNSALCNYNAHIFIFDSACTAHHQEYDKQPGSVLDVYLPKFNDGGTGYDIDFHQLYAPVIVPTRSGLYLKTVSVDSTNTPAPQFAITDYNDITTGQGIPIDQYLSKFTYFDNIFFAQNPSSAQRTEGNVSLDGSAWNWIHGNSPQINTQNLNNAVQWSNDLKNRATTIISGTMSAPDITGISINAYIKSSGKQLPLSPEYDHVKADGTWELPFTLLNSAVVKIVFSKEGFMPTVRNVNVSYNHQNGTASEISPISVTMHPTNLNNVIVSAAGTFSFTTINDAIDFVYDIASSPSYAEEPIKIRVIADTYHENIDLSPLTWCGVKDFSLEGIGNVTIDGLGNEYCINLEHSYINPLYELMDFKIININMTNAKHGVYFKDILEEFEDYAPHINLTIRNCGFQNCGGAAYEDTFGGGVHFSGAGIIENNVFATNSMDNNQWVNSNRAGALYIHNDSSAEADVKGNIFTDNTGGFAGALVATGSGRIWVRRNHFEDNIESGFVNDLRAANSLSVYDVSKISITNNVFIDNRSTPGLTSGKEVALDAYAAIHSNVEPIIFENNTLLSINQTNLLSFWHSSNNAIQDIEIRNNVFSNTGQGSSTVSSLNYGNPTVEYNIFHNTVPTGFAGSFSATNIEEDPKLDVNHQPIWTASIMSPCIDAGYGDPDTDGTPPDIGAYRTCDHRYWEYAFEDQADRDRWYWVSYPVLNTITDNALQASEFFQDLLVKYQDEDNQWHPVYLDRIDWMVEGDLESIAWYNEDWTSTQFTHYVSSPQGYKIKLLQGVPETVTFTESGFKTPDNLQFPIYGEVENWLGYFCEESRMPQDAFAAIWDDITMVRTKDWCLYRDPNGGLGKVAGIILPINYGDMVIVTTMNDHSFRWGSSNPVPPHSKSRSESFIYDEKADYIPVYINIPEDMQMDLKEIGLYLDGICKGAVVIDSDYEQISAYVDSPDELINSDLELVFHYDDSKRPDSELRATSYHPGKMQPQYGFSGARYPFYEISISQKDLDNIKPPVFGLNQNYPNPFNPITTISYSMPEAAKVRLDIYNLKGQLVKTLIDSEMEAGPHSVVWNGKDGNNQAVASGIYFYRLSSPNNTQTKRMLLMK